MEGDDDRRVGCSSVRETSRAPRSAIVAMDRGRPRRSMIEGAAPSRGSVPSSGMAKSKTGSSGGSATLRPKIASRPRSAASMSSLRATHPRGADRHPSRPDAVRMIQTEPAGTAGMNARRINGDDFEVDTASQLQQVVVRPHIGVPLAEGHVDVEARADMRHAFGEAGGNHRQVVEMQQGPLTPRRAGCPCAAPSARGRSPRDRRWPRAGRCAR